MIYLVILFSKSLTSESHTQGLGKGIHASSPSHTGSWGQDPLSLFQDLFGQQSQRGGVGRWGYSLEKLENSQCQILAGKQKQV